LNRYASVGLGAVVAAAVLVPLYAEIRASRVSHPEWARMLVRAIHTTEVVEASTQASQVFAILSWRESLSYRADRYFRGEKVTVSTEGENTCVSGAGATGEVAYRLGIVRAGYYRIRARTRGASAQPLVAQLARADGSPVATYDVVPAPILGWSDARARAGAPRRFSPGGYVASFLVPPGTCLANVEVVPPCLQPIEPLGGWKPRAVTIASDVAATLLKATDLESELPPAATAREHPGSDFDIDESTGQPQAILAAAGPEMSWLKGGVTGTRGLLMVTIPEDGLYNVSVLGRFPSAQRWGLDSCFETLLCPTGEKDGLRWRSIASLSMMAGRHLLSVDLAPDSIVARIKLERKKSAPEDYLATLRRLGFDAGPEGPVTRKLAQDALGFLKARLSVPEAKGCTDAQFTFPPEPGARAGDQFALAQPAQPASAPAAPPNAGPGLPPIAPPSIDPGPLSSPPTPEPPPPDPGTPVPPTPVAPTIAPPTPIPTTPTPPTPTPPTPTPTPTDTPTPLPRPTCSSPPPCPP